MLPVISEFQSKLFPIAKAVKKRYFTNIDVDNEEEFRPRYVEVSSLFPQMSVWSMYSTLYGGLVAYKGPKLFHPL